MMHATATAAARAGALDVMSTPYGWPIGCNYVSLKPVGLQKEAVMSKLKAIITTLVLGASSSAMASPMTSVRPVARDYDRGYDRDYNDRARRDRRYIVARDARDTDQRYVYDRYDRDDAGPRRYRPAWVALDPSLSLEPGRERIPVNMRGTFTQLRFQVASGRTFVHRVVVRFADGSRQVVEVHRMLSERDRMFQFELNGDNRRIDSITVLGDARHSGSISVFGI